MGCAILPGHAHATFVIICAFKRPYAISKNEESLFNSVCLSIEGLCAREKSEADEAEYTSKQYYDNLVLHSLLIGDVMHEAIEAMIVSRNNLAVAKPINPKHDEKLQVVKITLNGLISSALAFKDGISKNTNGNQKKYAKCDMSKLVQMVISKY
jgi:K+-transporting ATPase A subunit